MLKRLLAVGLAAMSCNVCIAQDYEEMAQKAWTAMVCAELAWRAGDEEAGNRLFKLGNDVGAAFLSAERQAGVMFPSSYDRPTLRDYAPRGSVEFSMGYAWAMVEAQVNKELPLGSDWLAYEALYAERNCRYVM